MKKIILSLVSIIATMSAMAITYTAKTTITFATADDSQTFQMIIGQSNDLVAGYNKGYCSEVNFEGQQIAMYTMYNSKSYQKFAERELGEMPFTLQTNAATSYKMTFSNVKGTEVLTMYDAVEDKYTDIVEGGSYAFTAAANQTIADRFMLKKKPAEPTICHQYGNLIITGHQGAKVKVLDMADAVAIAEQTLATDDEVISLSSLEKGAMYQVVMDEEVMLIRIQ